MNIANIILIAIIAVVSLNTGLCIGVCLGIKEEHKLCMRVLPKIFEGNHNES